MMTLSPQGAALLLAVAALGDASTGGIDLDRATGPDRPPPPHQPNPGDVACAKCGAAPGQGCDRRGMSRHHYFHKARVDAFAASTPQEKQP